MNTVKSIFYLSLGICVGGLAAAAYAQQSDDSKSRSPTAKEQSSDQGVASRDKKYMEEIARINIAEVQASQIAARKASNPQVRQFAERMVQDHSKANEELARIAQRRNVTLPTEPDRSHQKKVKELDEVSADKFDRTYMNEIVKGHKDALKTVQDVAKNARDPELKAFAEKLAPDIQQHLQTAEQTASAVKAASK